MKYLRNLALFSLLVLVVAGCGGGNTTIAENNSSGGTGGSGGTSGTGNVTTSTVTLSWTAPTTWTDSSALSLSEISGYRIYYGSSATNTPKYVTVNDGTATQYSVTLPSGTYYFRMTTVATNGVEGPMSSAVQKNL